MRDVFLGAVDSFLRWEPDDRKVQPAPKEMPMNVPPAEENSLPPLH